jgi:hypothetical protein
VARPDLIEHAKPQARHAQRLGLRKVALIGARKQRGRFPHAAEPLTEAHGAEKIFFGRREPVPSTRSIQCHACSGWSCRNSTRFPTASRKAFPLSPCGQSTGKIDSSNVRRRGKCEGSSNAAMKRREGRGT